MRYEGETGNAPWNDEGYWRQPLRAALVFTPIEPEPFLTDVPVPTEKTPCWDEPDLWFSDRKGRLGQQDAREAKNLCSGCWMLKECREYAIDHDVEGVWGGLTKAERRDRRRKLDEKVVVRTLPSARPPRMRAPSRRSA